MDDAFDRQGPEFEAVEPGVTGEVFRAGDSDDLAATIETALAKYRKPQCMSVCHRRVDSCYTPGYQAAIINELVLIGRRKNPPIPFLSRSHPLNKFLGKFLTKLGLR